MALPLLAGLNAAARAALPVIQAGVTKGLSSRAIQGVLKKTFGKGIRRQTLLDIMRAETGIERAGALLKFVGLNKIPNIARMPTAITRLRRQTSFIVQVAGTILDTGISVIQNVTVALDTVLTRGEIERLAEKAITDNQERYGFSVDSTLLLRGVRAGQAGVL